MRKITILAVDALLNRTKFKRANTQVRNVNNSDVWEMLLHGCCIALYYGDGTLEICAGGWFTTTTKERLNGLPGISIYQKNFEWYLNDERWDGKWTFIR